MFIAAQVAVPIGVPSVLHSLEVKAVDDKTGLPVPVTGIVYPEHRDFSYSTSKRERLIHKATFGSDSGIMEIVWLGKGKAEEYSFVLSSDGYEDRVVPFDFIETISSTTSGRPEEAKVLRMKRAEQAVPPKSDRAGG